MDSTPSTFDTMPVFVCPDCGFSLGERPPVRCPVCAADITGLRVAALRFRHERACAAFRGNLLRCLAWISVAALGFCPGAAAGYGLFWAIMHYGIPERISWVYRFHAQGFWIGCGLAAFLVFLAIPKTRRAIFSLLRRKIILYTVIGLAIPLPRKIIIFTVCKILWPALCGIAVFLVFIVTKLVKILFCIPQ